MTISLSAAVALVERRCQPGPACEAVPLADALGRVLAEAVTAPIAVPAADNSAVDGYGFRHAGLKLARERGLAVIGVSAAGRPFDGAVGEGEAVRIFTGALPPPGVDAIAMQEEVQRDGDRILLRKDIPLDANIRRAGEDIAKGSVAISAGRRLGPVDIGMLSSLGVVEAQVRRRLRVAVLSAGDELIEPGQPLRPGAVHDSNRPLLLAFVRQLGFDSVDLGILPDSRPAIEAALADAARGCDAIISSAGVSVGDEDHMRQAIETLGALDFWSVAIKPGKPVAAGHVAGKPYFGLPGNPVAAVITFLLLARPGLLRLAGGAYTAPPRYPVRAGFTLRRSPGRREFLRCMLDMDADGLCVRRFARGGSAVLSSVGGSDGLVEIAEDVTEIAPGQPVSFIPFAEFGL